MVTKSKKNLYFVEESSKMILTTGKVRRKLGETLSHGVPLIVKIGLFGIPLRKYRPALVRGLSETF